MSKYLITIVGPTAIGKTSLSIKLAQYFDADIISADSRQFYKELNIGTAVPTISELNQAKHHFIHHKSIKEEYSVGDFERDALGVIDTLFKTNNVVILVGGSGLYIDAISKGLDILLPNGLMIITIYRGHEEGDIESDRILEFVHTLSSKHFNVLKYEMLNKKTMQYTIDFITSVF